MATNTFRGLLAAALALFVLTGAARADGWQIDKSSGDLWIGSAGTQPVSLGPTAQSVPDGATVITGGNGRILLSRGGQTMTIGPNSVATVPNGDTQKQTTILQQAGEITFDEEAPTVAPFAVETPLLAAVVKGTQFTVQVGPDSTAVSVDRGLVEVTNLSTGEVADIGPSQSAAVPGPGKKLTTSSIDIPVKVGPPRPAATQSLTVAERTALQTAAQNAPAQGGSRSSADGGNSDRAGSTIAVAAAGSGGNGGNGGGNSGNFDPNAGGKGGSGASLAQGDNGSGEGAGTPGIAIDVSGTSLVSALPLGNPTARRVTADRSDVSVQQLVLALVVLVGAMCGLGVAYLNAKMR